MQRQNFAKFESFISLIINLSDKVIDKKNDKEKALRLVEQEKNVSLNFAFSTLQMGVIVFFWCDNVSLLKNTSLFLTVNEFAVMLNRKGKINKTICLDENKGYICGIKV